VKCRVWFAAIKKILKETGRNHSHRTIGHLLIQTFPSAGTQQFRKSHPKKAWLQSIKQSEPPVTVGSPEDEAAVERRDANPQLHSWLGPAGESSPNVRQGWQNIKIKKIVQWFVGSRLRLVWLHLNKNRSLHCRLDWTGPFSRLSAATKAEEENNCRQQNCQVKSRAVPCSAALWERCVAFIRLVVVKMDRAGPVGGIVQKRLRSQVPKPARDHALPAFPSPSPSLGGGQGARAKGGRWDGKGRKKKKNAPQQ
jgi:hypothetical protein